MSEPWSPERLVWPWSMEKFTGSPGDKQCVTENLTRRRFPLSQYKKEPPNERIITTASKLLCKMLNIYDEGGVPWFMLMSNSTPLLQALAMLMPLGYSLTTMGSCAITDTAILSELFYSRKGEDIGLDPIAETLQSYVLAGFLSWERVNAAVPGGAKQEGRFAALMEWRLRNRLCTLLTAPYHIWQPDTRSRILAKIDVNLGSAVAAAMAESVPLNLKTTLQTAECTTMEV